MDMYLFPFNEVPHGSKIIIYGAGTVGQTYLYQVVMTKYCNLICIADRNPSQYQSLSVDVLEVGEALKREFDYIIIANASSKWANEIIHMLINTYNIPISQIIYKNEYLEPIHVVRYDENSLYEKYVNSLAFSQKRKYTISIHLEGGFGDYIVRKNNIIDVSQWDENILIDIYVSKGKKSFTEHLFKDVSNINIISDEDALYFISKKKYLAAFRFTAYLIVDNIEDRKDLPFSLSRRLHTIQTKYDNYGLREGGVSFAIHYARCKKDGFNCYTAYNRYGGFDVKEQKTSIPLIEKYKYDFNNLGIENYVTVNYGWDRNQKKIPAKVWPFEYLRELTLMIKESYSQINVVQIGMKDSPLLDGCIQIIDKNIELVKYILLHSRLHIDCEGGMVHLATQLGTKCAVVFGPTPVEYYGYEQNINIVPDSCSDCYWYVPDCVSCYRGMDKPICMYESTPEKVFKAISDELEDISR